MKFLNIIPFCIFLFSLNPPSVNAQSFYKAGKECRGIFHLDGGVNLLTNTSKTGLHYGIGYEGVVSEFASLGFNLKNAVNGTGLYKIENGLPTGAEIQEQRVAFCLEVRLYPVAALYGFYVGAGGGVGLHVNSSRRDGSLYFLSNDPYGLGQVKVGYQLVRRNNLTLSMHLGGDLFFKPDVSENGIMIHAGIQIGIKI